MQNKNTQEMLDKIKQAKVSQSTKSTKKPLIILGISLLSISLIGGGGYLVYQALPKNQVVEKQTKTIQSEDKKTEKKEVTRAIPIELPQWAKKPYYALTDEDIQALAQAQEQTFIGWNTSAYPSEKDGFTSDISKAYDNDGIPNEKYVSLTQEELTKQLGILVNRVVNSVFGDWEAYQYPNHPNLVSRSLIISNLYAGIGQTDYLNDLIEHPEKEPIFFIDNLNNDYNNTVPINIEQSDRRSARFIGVIKSGQITYDNDKITINMTVDYMYNKTEIYKTKEIKIDITREDKQLIITGGEIHDKK